MNVYYKDGKIHVIAGSMSELVTANEVNRQESGNGCERIDYVLKLIPVVVTTTDGEFTEIEHEFIQFYGNCFTPADISTNPEKGLQK